MIPPHNEINKDTIKVEINFSILMMKDLFKKLQFQMMLIYLDEHEMRYDYVAYDD